MSILQHKPIQRATVGWCVVIVAWASFLLGAGCPPDARYMAMEREILQQREEIQGLESRIADQRDTIKVLRLQVSERLGDKGKNLEELLSLGGLSIASLSGGYKAEGQAGDIGVVVYLQPIDTYGDVVKAPGHIEISLYDLANPEDKTFYQSYRFESKHLLDELWYGKMWTYHYTLKCPWPPSGPPAHDRLTVKVVFIHEITGQRLEAQTVVGVQLPLAQ